MPVTDTATDSGHGRNRHGAPIPSAAGVVGVRETTRCEEGISRLARSLEMTWVEKRRTVHREGARQRLVAWASSPRRAPRPPRTNPTGGRMPPAPWETATSGQLAASLSSCHPERACESRGPPLEVEDVPASNSAGFFSGCLYPRPRSVVPMSARPGGSPWSPNQALHKGECSPLVLLFHCMARTRS